MGANFCCLFILPFIQLNSQSLRRRHKSTFGRDIVLLPCGRIRKELKCACLPPTSVTSGCDEKNILYKFLEAQDFLAHHLHFLIV